ncbi:amidohydrolase [Rhodovulum sulfidophilum]|uniref:Carbon-nitrogen hydrolase family protein n=1 Tax=Rhodovulum visakhapatnamense TaxID=364297 RepID=A0ABS1RC99_9RHOB|nr:carbon-nitrogen hydrolase family protein [Rhodovulum visakhapatnamense]MBL3568295.1 carbon-nitrogen hydrolase family protein [Rhodovulum visakhapatnamense]MBL3576567.1 carbon-nitrogen hydrolase family protein [Rhodovulum visakhapatnamense]OLS43241.1 amidohydrolase [Rhodovulum sulfidophilum]
MRAALIQLTSSDLPDENIGLVRESMREAVAGGADLILTPEVTNCLSPSRVRQNEVLKEEADDPTLAALRQEAASLGVWLLIGSLGLKTSDPDGRFANRSFLIGPGGAIAARYDKIHMFDVEISETETFRESDGYRPGTRAVVAPTPFGTMGLAICYDLRFPHLFRALAHAGAEILTVPAAFSPVTGAAHWEPLLRARAIENGCYVLAPAQCGLHPAAEGRPRRTHGHSLAVSPWGEVLADGGEAPGIVYVDLDREEVVRARARVPSIFHDRDFEGP